MRAGKGRNIRNHAHVGGARRAIPAKTPYLGGQKGGVSEIIWARQGALGNMPYIGRMSEGVPEATPFMGMLGNTIYGHACTQKGSVSEATTWAAVK